MDTKGKYTVWGDYLNSETRAILAIMKMQEIDNEFKLIDTLKNEQKSDAYIKQSLVEHIPMISNEKFKVFGGDFTPIRYLKNAHTDKMKDIYPEKFAQQIEACVKWYQNKLRFLT
jgi:hypothetical protein